MGSLLSCTPKRMNNGWMLSPEVPIPGHFFIRMFPPVAGCSPLIVVKSFSKQSDLLRFREEIEALPAASAEHNVQEELPPLDTWQNYDNGWSCKINLYATVQDERSGRHRYILWVKKPPIWTLRIGRWKWNHGRRLIKATEPMLKNVVENYIAYFRSI